VDFLEIIGKGVGRYWPQLTRSYFWGFTPLCLIWWKSTKKCDRESDDTWTDIQTDANRFYYLPHAICYSNGTDKNNNNITPASKLHLRHSQSLGGEDDGTRLWRCDDTRLRSNVRGNFVVSRTQHHVTDKAFFIAGPHAARLSKLLWIPAIHAVIKYQDGSKNEHIKNNTDTINISNVSNTVEIPIQYAWFWPKVDVQ